MSLCPTRPTSLSDLSAWSDLHLIEHIGTIRDLQRMTVQLGCTETAFDYERTLFILEREAISRGIDCEKL